MKKAIPYVSFALFMITACFFGSLFIFKSIGAFPGFTSSVEVMMGGDKIMHVIVWDLLVLFFMLVRGSQTFVDAAAVFKLLLIIVVLPMSLEAVQLLVPHGNFSFQDGISSCLGAFLGAQTALIIMVVFNYE